MGPHGSPLAGAGTGAGVAMVVGVRRNERRQKQMGARRVKCDMVRPFLGSPRLFGLLECSGRDR